MGLLEYVSGVLGFGRVYASVFSGKDDYVKVSCRISIEIKIWGGDSEYIPYFFKDWICSLGNVSEDIGYVGVDLRVKFMEVCFDLIVWKEYYSVCFGLNESCVSVSAYYGVGQKVTREFCIEEGDDVDREKVVEAFSPMPYWGVPEVVGYAYDILEIMYRNLRGKEEDAVLLGMFP